MRENKLKIFNTLSRTKEEFKAIDPPFVGMYVCGPTVYGDVHLGNCRTFIYFDVVFRYLKQLGYKVRYVRNITDVGHLTGDVDIGSEDKIGKKARMEKVEPMEIVQKYTNGFHKVMRDFNAQDPSIEPTATGHIVEQIEMVRSILENGLAYEKNGSVYLDTQAFVKKYPDTYGKLSGREIENLLVETRDDLKNQDEKNHPSDFAIWVKAPKEHLMHWPSPWSEGFPGWHLECSVMSTKYLGSPFDIHGGGMDLQFPHHENEIAQNFSACGCAPSNFWMHCNMLLMNGKKMSRSDGNTVSSAELFSGNSPLLSQAYSPMTVRFFILQTHYRSTLDISDMALKAAEKGFNRLLEGQKTLNNLVYKAGDINESEDNEIKAACNDCYKHMDDDFNTPMTLASLFTLVTKINVFKDKGGVVSTIQESTLNTLKETFHDFIENVLGLKEEVAGDDGLVDGLMQLIIDIRGTSREKKDWDTSDKIRNTLQELEVQLKDGKEGTSWTKA